MGTTMDRTIARLQAADLRRFNAVLGFDGFIDEMVHIVEQRQDLERYTPVPSLTRFGDHLHAASGRSSLRELVITERRAGGCAVNSSDALASLGVDCAVFATIGDPVSPAFAELADKARLFPIGDFYGRTMCCEFNDGKYMLSEMEQMKRVTPALLAERLSELQRECARAQVIACTNWSIYPHMSACWSWLQETVLSNLTQEPWLLIDLVDPRSRETADIRAMLPILGSFEAKGRCCFSGNLNEGNVLAELLDIEPATEDSELPGLCAAIRDTLSISMVSLHSITGAALAGAEGAVGIAGPYTATPKQSTGAGDRFNAGLMLGLLLGAEGIDCLRLGAASSGFFVRLARSASLVELIDFLRVWDAGTLDR